jgi:dTDP-glucose 4,6-dehydratase/UDP-glucuronate decarboxylase
VETARIPDAERLIVIHAASYGSPLDYLRHPIETFEANTTSLVRLVRHCNPDRVTQFVYLSSAEIYGQAPDTAIPTPEGFVGGVATLAARSIYAESKRMGEVLGVSLAHDLGIPFTVLRPWNVYGPGQRLEDGRVPIEFVRNALQEGVIRLTSNGTPRRAFCYVWDSIRQIVSTLGRTTSVEAFNIGHGGEEVSILDLALHCAAACGLSAKAVQCDPTARSVGLHRCAPDTRAVQALAAEPWAFTRLTVGLRSLRDWAEFMQSTECPIC